MFKLYYFLCVLVMVTSLQGRVIEKTIAIYGIKERVNGVEFVHKSELIDGKLQEVWAINGKTVGYDDYLEAILEAEKEERRAERKKELAKRKRDEEFKIMAHNNAMKKLIHNKVQDIQQLLRKVTQPLLARFLQFNTTTVACQDDLSKIKEAIEYAQSKAESDEPYNFSTLQLCLDSLEGYPDRLEKLYKESINHAIATCNDTRSLKDLLEMV